jgi:DNA helicase II / ATP-dependent DNA helicase PcrA
VERKYKQAFAGLNARQRKAVETIDGPVLVVAGPGTGKTQLISTRVGYILQKTDTPADSILLLTFTEAGVQAMRDRLNLLIGKPAYDIQLSTYHAFGGEIFRRYPDYFEGLNLTLLEELGADSLLRSIIAKLPYSDPLKFADAYINDLKSFISESKRALLAPEDISQIAKDNLEFIAGASKDHRQLLNQLNLVSKKSLPIFKELLTLLSEGGKSKLPDGVLPLANSASDELERAIEYFNSTAKTTQLSEWKRRWLARDARGNYIIEGRRINERLMSAGRIYKRYQERLRRQGLYDYDDMIIRAIDALEANPELKYSLAERYSYIMLDEFQDTNPAQFRLVQLLSDHPVHEGRPNVLAVGDDDQAIYAFQGADHANMVNFVRHYKDVKIISLQENYRSTPSIIETGQNITSQVQTRLVNQFENITKELRSAAADKKTVITAREFKSDAAQYDWVATEIDKLIKKGTPASEIAVLAPKHRYLTALLPYLAQYKLPVYYERRENILDEPMVHQLEQMSKLVLALAEGDERSSNYLWTEVLSYDFWNVPTEKIWLISWQSRQSQEPWTSILLNDQPLKNIASFFIKLASVLEVTSLEQQLDALLGVPGISDELKLPQTSPMYDFYFSADNSKTDPLMFTRLISNLNVLRARLRDWRQNQEEPLGLKALVEFIEGHRAAGLNITNTSPYHETRDAVNLVTAYGAKGREFQAVFIIGAVDEIWGSASRNQGYRLSLPANLSYIRYQGASEDERLRLLYVAVTRAKIKLYFTGYTQDLSGKHLTRLKYMDIDQADGRLISGILPDRFSEIRTDESDSIALSTAFNYWTQKHTPPLNPKLQEILKPRLQAYKISATDLRTFIDIVNSGPEVFFMKCLLRFPTSPTVTDSFGTAIHNTLRFAGRILQTEQRLPDIERLAEIFDAQLGRIDLPPDEFSNLSKRGRDSLKAWLAQSAPDLKTTDRYEYDFQNEASRIGEVQLTGKVDRILIDEKRRKITVVDYKTGRAYSRWQSGVVKLHIFQLQLIFYKLLIENSARYKKYQVEKGIIEFVEPDADGQIHRLEFDFDQPQTNQTVKLIAAVWLCIHELRLPDISGYPRTLAGIRKFETDLTASNKNTS